MSASAALTPESGPPAQSPGGDGSTARYPKGQNRAPTRRPPTQGGNPLPGADSLSSTKLTIGYKS